MKTAGALISLLALAFFHAPADGSGRARSLCGSYVVPPAVTYYAPAASYAVQAVPYYSVGYSGAGELAEIVKLLIEDNRAMRADLVQTLKAMQGGPVPAKAAPAHPGLVALNQACGQCHDSARGKPKKDFGFLNGGAFVDTGDNLAKVLDAVDHYGPLAKDGRAYMPPMPHEPLPDKLTLAINSYLNRLPPPEKAAAKPPEK